MALGGVGGMTIGTIASFLQLSRSFMNPISQISNQLNMVVMALAGAERIFKLMDEEPEVDEGYVTLVNAKYDENGKEIKKVTSTDGGNVEDPDNKGDNPGGGNTPSGGDTPSGGGDGE